MSAIPLQPRIAIAAILLVAAAGPWLAAGTATAGVSASFGQTVVYEQTGDVASITVSASQTATVNLGSAGTGFWLQVRVGKGTTKLRLNTYKAGESDRYSLSEMVWTTKGSIKTRTLQTVPIDGPLEPAEYHMNVTINGHERAVGTLVVNKRQTKDITARIAPRATDVSKLSTTAEVRKATVPPWNGSVARDDWLLVRVNATGVRGALEKSQLDGNTGVMRVEFIQRNPPPNSPQNRFTGASVERVFVDGEGFYLAVDTGDHAIEAGDEYRVSFKIPAASPLAEAEQKVSTYVRVAERRVTVKRNGPDGRKIIVENETTVSGTTTLTPGTTINISARDTGTDPFLRPRIVTVGNDRTFSVTFDFSNLDPGREFELRLGDQDVTIPAAVAEPTTTTTTTATAKTTTTTTAKTTTTETVTTTASPTTTATTNAATDGPTQKAQNDTEEVLTQQAAKTEGDDGGNGGPVPGFGPVAGLVALAAGLALAIRRL